MRAGARRPPPRRTAWAPTSRPPGPSLATLLDEAWPGLMHAAARGAACTKALGDLDPAWVAATVASLEARPAGRPLARDGADAGGARRRRGGRDARAGRRRLCARPDAEPVIVFALLCARLGGVAAAAAWIGMPSAATVAVGVAGAAAVGAVLRPFRWWSEADEDARIVTAAVTQVVDVDLATQVSIGVGTGAWVSLVAAALAVGGPRSRSGGRGAPARTEPPQTARGGVGRSSLQSGRDGADTGWVPSLNDLVLVRGMDSTKAALRRWNERPWRTLLPWALLSLGIGVGLLLATWLVARNATPDLTPLRIPGYYSGARLDDVVHVLTRNASVLALHALACVAGFMAGSSLPQSAAQRSGVDRWVHETAGPLAIGFVTLATLFSLVTQAYVIGNTASTVASQVGVSPAELLAVYSIHAIPELTALFLPLAAWLVASRSKRWDELLAATVVTVAIAIPVLLASVALELWVTPEVLGWVAPDSHAIWSR